MKIIIAFAFCLLASGIYFKISLNIYSYLEEYILFFSVWAYDYEIEGPVENVLYVPSHVHPCYIALSHGGTRQYYYHAAYSVAQCEFADRARYSGQDVKIYGEIGSSTQNNGVLGIEYARTKSKFWFAENALHP